MFAADSVLVAVLGPDARVERVETRRLKRWENGNDERVAF
jgi:hypothetical protein